MRNNTQLLSAILPALMMVFLFACGENNSIQNSQPANAKSPDEQALTIDTFSTFPREIDGCSCYFSNDSTEFNRHVYVYMNNYGKISFLKINGVLTKFTQSESKEVNETTTVTKAKSEDYEMTIEVVDGIQNGEETWLKTGTIKLTDKNGNTVTKTFYGECGC